MASPKFLAEIINILLLMLDPFYDNIIFLNYTTIILTILINPCQSIFAV
jgi:hypothetical protein